MSNNTNGSVIVFNSSRSSAEEQFELLQKLPVSHEYGDSLTTFVIDGLDKKLDRKQTDLIVSPEFRIKTRKRCTLLPLDVRYICSGALRRPIEPFQVLACFLAVHDWQAEGLDAERFFLKSDTDAASGPKIGPYYFDFAAYALSVYEDLAMCFDSLKAIVNANKLKCHLKIVPLSVGPTIKTRYGDLLAPYVVPVYLIALQFACNAFLNSSWVHTLEFVDHSRGLMTPTVDLSGIRVLSGISRDALNFSGCIGMPAILLPCDSFCVLGSRDRNLASTIASNTNLKDFDLMGSTFSAWPFSKGALV